jgi:hypothetical protein
MDGALGWRNIKERWVALVIFAHKHMILIQLLNKYIWSWSKLVK